MRDEFVWYARRFIDNYTTEPKFEAKSRVISLSRDLVKNSIINDTRWWIKCPVCNNEFNTLPNM